MGQLGGPQQRWWGRGNGRGLSYRGLAAQGEVRRAQARIFFTWAELWCACADGGHSGIVGSFQTGSGFRCYGPIVCIECLMDLGIYRGAMCSAVPPGMSGQQAGSGRVGQACLV